MSMLKYFYFDNRRYTLKYLGVMGSVLLVYSQMIKKIITYTQNDKANGQNVKN